MLTLDITKWDWQLILPAGHYLMYPAAVFAWKLVKKRVQSYLSSLATGSVQSLATNPQFVATLAESVVKKINGTYMYGTEQREINGRVEGRLKRIEESLAVDQERREEMHKSNTDRFSSIEQAISKLPKRK